MQIPIRKMFLGGNTGYGFYSFYEQVVNGAAVKVYILKGGPGTGKSSFMRYLAAQAVAHGHAVEEFHCSSDSASLDGVHIPSLGVIMVDGTAPHVVDPVHPGAIETVLDLSQFWNEQALREQRATVQETVAVKGFLFRRTYGWLQLARQAQQECNTYLQELGAIDMAVIQQITVQLVQKLLPEFNTKGKLSQVRHLFASAITPQGPMNYLPTILQGMEQRVLLQGGVGLEANGIITTLAQAAQQRGYDCEVFHCALDPQRIDHLLIPQLQLAVCNSRPPHDLVPVSGDRVIDLGVHYDGSKTEHFAVELARLQSLQDEALTAAVELLRRAKEHHAYLETIYTQHMDFARLNRLRTQVVQEVLSLATVAQQD